MSTLTSQFSHVMERYDQTRMRNQKILDQRTEDINQKIPAMQDIHLKIIHLSFRQAREEVLHPSESPAHLVEYARRLDELMCQKQDLLEKHGYPRDYLSPIYTCPDCKDTGYIDSRPCHCLQAERTDILYANANLSDILESENFSTFQADYYDDTAIDDNLSLTARENILRLREVCQDFIKHFDDAYDNLIFYGPTGVGKTFLTHCIAKELLDTGHTVVYLTSLQLFDILEKNRFGREDAGQRERLQEQIGFFIDCDLLVIDDLGTELTNSFTVSELYHFIEERHLNKRSSIISTNLSFHDLHERYGERIFSRFTGYYNFCKIIGEDIRPMKRLSQP